MALNIEVEADHDGTLLNRDIRSALGNLSGVSKSSPLSAGGDEVGIVLGDESVTLRIAGYDGSFTKTSQDALVSTVRGLDAVDADSVTVVEGGYDAIDAGEDDDGEDDDDE